MAKEIKFGEDTYLSGEKLYAPSLENVDAIFLANSME